MYILALFQNIGCFVIFGYTVSSMYLDIVYLQVHKNLCTYKVQIRATIWDEVFEDRKIFNGLSSELVQY